jgi:hypothetical protein
MLGRRNKTKRWGNFLKKPEKSSLIWEESSQFPFTLHNDDFSQATLVLKSDLFPGIVPNDIIEIVPAENAAPPFVMQVTEDSFENKNLSVSLK